LGLARRSSGAAKAWVALARQASNSCGYTPFSRHQALRVDSSMAAVVITALNRDASAVTSAAVLQTFPSAHDYTDTTYHFSTNPYPQLT
jgi:hypothetical protein